MHIIHKLTSDSPLNHIPSFTFRLEAATWMFFKCVKCNNLKLQIFTLPLIFLSLTSLFLFTFLVYAYQAQNILDCIFVLFLLIQLSKTCI